MCEEVEATVVPGKTLKKPSMNIETDSENVGTMDDDV